MNRRVFGWVEVVFDALYLLFGLILGLWALSRGARMPAALALTLAGGDAFHLVPRMLSVIGGRELRRALGIGKLITSLTMTAFYLLLASAGGGHMPLAYALAAARAILCLLPQNDWLSSDPPVRWGVLRNIPFVLLGAQVAILYAPKSPGMAIAIALSFLFYLPVVLFSGKNRKIGMLMLPKTLMYVWMLLNCALAA